MFICNNIPADECFRDGQYIAVPLVLVHLDSIPDRQNDLKGSKTKEIKENNYKERVRIGSLLTRIILLDFYKKKNKARNSRFVYIQTDAFVHSLEISKYLKINVWKTILRFNICTYLLLGVGVDGRTILKWTLKKQVSIRRIGLIQLRIGITGEPL